MADTHETNRPTVIAAEAVRELLARQPAPGQDIVWLADQLLGIVQHLGSVALNRDREADALTCRSGSVVVSASGRGPVYLLRPLLARLAVLGADETGTECSPYGGRYALARSSRSGPVRLEVEFTNTPAVQQLTLTRVPVAVGPRVPAPEAGIADDAPRSSV